MELYLVQHGEARPKAEDPNRPLTQQGREDVARVADFARSAGIQIYQIQHSGILRAEQTAEILAECLAPPGGLVAVPGLAPKGDVTRFAELLNREAKSLMLVGHQPFMARLAGLLVAGDAERPIVQFDKGGIVCLLRESGAGTWLIQWAVTPQLVP